MHHTTADLYTVQCELCSGNLAVFTVLCEQYHLALQRDPTYMDVSQYFFNPSLI